MGKEEKIALDIVGLSYSQTQSGAYALVLSEQDGQRRLPIIIGSFEAQAIAIELEAMTPSRPLTHDLFKSFAESFDVQINEVVIYNLIEGIFYAKLICSKNGKEVEIDTRTSDAVALAVRFKCPIYTYEFILEAAGIVLEDDVEGEQPIPKKSATPPFQKQSKAAGKSLEQLKHMLQEAIKMENYEEASKIRDEIKKRTGNN